MMATILALLAVQDAQSAELAAIRECIREYAANGDMASKERLLAKGASVIPVIYDEREEHHQVDAFTRLSDLLLTLKFASIADKPAIRLRDALVSTSMVLEGWPPKDRPSRSGEPRLQWLAYDMSKAIGRDVRLRLFVDPVACPDMLEAALPLPAEAVQDKIYFQLDRVCSRMDLDWTCWRGVLLISSPARLWGWPAPTPERLDGAARTLVDRALEDMDANDIERRTQAIRRATELGPAALPFLKEAGLSKEGAAGIKRARALIQRRYGHRVWLPGEELEGARLSESLASRLTEFGLSESTTFDAERLDSVLSRLSRAVEVDITVAPKAADWKITLDAGGLTARVVLDLITRAFGLRVDEKEGALRLTPR